MLSSKRIAIALVALCISVISGAQSRFGFVGGITSTSMEFSQADFQSSDQYHVGMVFNVPLAAGFAMQPEVLYNVKGATLSQMFGVDGFAEAVHTLDTRCAFLELAAQLQWGVSAGRSRGYLFAEPFAGYAVSNEIKSSIAASVIENAFPELVKSVQNDFNYLNKLEYGLGVGVGMDLFRAIQISAKYYWNLGPLYNGDELSNEDMANQALKSFVNLFKEQKGFTGFTVSLGLLF